MIHPRGVSLVKIVRNFCSLVGLSQTLMFSVILQRFCWRLEIILSDMPLGYTLWDPPCFAVFRMFLPSLHIRNSCIEEYNLPIHGRRPTQSGAVVFRGVAAGGGGWVGCGTALASEAVGKFLKYRFLLANVGLSVVSKMHQYS